MLARLRILGPNQGGQLIKLTARFLLCNFLSFQIEPSLFENQF